MGCAKEYHVVRLLREVPRHRLALASRPIVLIAERVLDLPESY
jgi:hypothetical protein